MPAHRREAATHATDAAGSAAQPARQPDRPRRRLSQLFQRRNGINKGQ
ncbi:hypothetical protein ECP03052938_1725 [Escherichia coli p0305293.8]|nr:hypothetical protein [Escherichia coli]ENG72178.1 hypothetical protein ECP03052938_1725 [Escherichia coli p0305293.8]